MLRHEIGAFGGVVAKIVPELRERLPELPEPVALDPAEERHRRSAACSASARVRPW